TRFNLKYRKSGSNLYLLRQPFGVSITTWIVEWSCLLNGFSAIGVAIVFLIFSTWRFPSPKLRCARISSRLPPRGQHQVARKPRYDDDSATPLVNQLPFSIPLNYSTGAKTNRDHVRTRAGRRGMAGLRTPGPS